jgi:hypothetical protein
MVKVVAGGILGGIVLFFWGFVAHMLLPIGEMGIHAIPNEDLVLNSMRNAIQEEGFYIFPSINMKEASESQQKTWEAKMKEGPSGVLVIQPKGRELVMSHLMLIEGATNIVSALLAALLLAQVRTGSRYWGRVAFVTLLGILGFVMVNVPFWNWYSFPTNFTIAQAIEHVAGWLLAGLVLAAIVRGRKDKEPGLA